MSLICVYACVSVVQYISECHSGGVISPEACEYIKDWLDT